MTEMIRDGLPDPVESDVDETAAPGRSLGDRLSDLNTKKNRQKLLKIGIHAFALFPLVWLIYDFWLGYLGPEPIRAITLRTGKAAIIMIVLSLACTPANILFGWRWTIRARRALGLYGFMYVGLHFLTFVWIDYQLMWGLIVEEIILRRYALVGFIAFLLLIPLALTSNKWAMRRLGKKWKPLHKLVYLIGILAVIHYFWLVKNAYTQPLIFASIVAFLLFVRLPGPKRFFQRTQRRARAHLASIRQAKG